MNWGMVVGTKAFANGQADEGSLCDIPTACTLERLDFEGLGPLAAPASPTAAAESLPGSLPRIRIVPPEPAEEPAPAPRSAQPGGFDGEWVLCEPQPHIHRWLENLTIHGDNVIDGAGKHVRLGHGTSGPSLCGGVLRLNAGRLLRYGKSGMVQMYRRRGPYLHVY
mmetsp:Transcript_71542/g.207365  ORF Transcript_71542/g.207365 Transcript_71542/m.207365 type:complete len:166 (+) Transcript_71542:1-498(+)